MAITVCRPLVGPYTVTLKNKEETTLSAMTFINPSMGWFEIVEIGNKTSVHMSHLLDHTWLSRSPHLENIIFDNRTEFKRYFRFIFKDYG